jgi:hypothetical protein
MTDVPQPTQLSAVHQNARILRDRGDLAGARLMLEQALEVAAATHGEDHPEVLLTARLLAGLHREAGDAAAARRVLEEALAAGQLKYGDTDPMMLAISYELGTVADELGNRHEARRNFGRVVAAGPAVLGADHWSVQKARQYLGEDASQPAASAPGPTNDSASPTAQTPPAVGPAAHTPPNRTSSFQAPTTPTPPAQTPSAVAPMPQPVTYQAPPTRPPLPPAPAYPPQQQPYRPVPPQQAQPASPAPSFPPDSARITSSPGPATSWPQATQPQAGWRQESTVPPPLAPVAAPPARRGRGVTVVVAVAAAVAVIASAVALIVVFTDRSGPPVSGPGTTATSSSAKAPQANPPGRLQLRDGGSVITVTWTDPTSGSVPFILAGGQSGQQQRALAQIPAGVTRYEENGLNPTLDYCFTVLAVYATDRLVPSDVVCTQRKTSPSASVR